MGIHKNRTKHPMTSAVWGEVRGYARRLEDNYRQRGLTREQARNDVARDLGVTPGTLENISRGRLKDPLRLRGLAAILHGAVTRELEREVARLSHELEIHRQTGVDPRADEVVAAEAALVEAREALGLEG